MNICYIIDNSITMKEHEKWLSYFAARLEYELCKNGIIKNKYSLVTFSKESEIVELDEDKIVSDIKHLKNVLQLDISFLEEKEDGYSAIKLAANNIDLMDGVIIFISNEDRDELEFNLDKNEIIDILDGNNIKFISLVKSKFYYEYDEVLGMSSDGYSFFSNEDIKGRGYVGDHFGSTKLDYIDISMLNGSSWNIDFISDSCDNLNLTTKNIATKFLEENDCSYEISLTQNYLYPKIYHQNNIHFEYYGDCSDFSVVFYTDSEKTNIYENYELGDDYSLWFEEDEVIPIISKKIDNKNNFIIVPPISFKENFEDKKSLIIGHDYYYDILSVEDVSSEIIKSGYIKIIKNKEYLSKELESSIYNSDNYILNHKVSYNKNLIVDKDSNGFIGEYKNKILVNEKILSKTNKNNFSENNSIIDIVNDDFNGIYVSQKREGHIEIYKDNFAKTNEEKIDNVDYEKHNIDFVLKLSGDSINGSIVDSGKIYPVSKDIFIEIDAIVSGGVNFVKLSNDNKIWSKWIDVYNNKENIRELKNNKIRIPWVLDSGKEIKTVYVKFLTDIGESNIQKIEVYNDYSLPSYKMSIYKDSSYIEKIDYKDKMGSGVFYIEFEIEEKIEEIEKIIDNSEIFLSDSNIYLDVIQDGFNDKVNIKLEKNGLKYRTSLIIEEHDNVFNIDGEYVFILRIPHPTLSSSLNHNPYIDYDILGRNSAKNYNNDNFIKKSSIRNRVNFIREDSNNDMGNNLNYV